MYIFDSQEQKNQHIIDFFNVNSIAFTIKKLAEGDYQIEDKPQKTVDRKQNLDELLINLCSKDKSRFWREVRRCQDKKIKLIILCEHGHGILGIKDIAKWKSKYSKITGRILLEKIYTCHISYDVDFIFCEKTETAQKIIDLLD